MTGDTVWFKSLPLAKLHFLQLERECEWEGAGDFPVVGGENKPEIVTGKLSQPNVLRHTDVAILNVGSVFTPVMDFFFLGYGTCLKPLHLLIHLFTHSFIS